MLQFFFYVVVQSQGVSPDFKWREWQIKTPKTPNPKVSPPKKSHAEFLTLKIFSKQNNFGCTLFAKPHCQDTWPLPQILDQATQKSTCQIFLPKKIPESKLSNPKKSCDHPCHLKSRVPPPPPLGVLIKLPWFKFNVFFFLFLYFYSV